MNQYIVTLSQMFNLTYSDLATAIDKSKKEPAGFHKYRRKLLLNYDLQQN